MTQANIRKALKSHPVLRGLFELGPPPPHRTLFALRAAFCMGAPIAAGWYLGDISAGLMAAIGGFTALYGGGRPYVSRALELGAIALAFGVTSGIGMWVAPWPLAVILTVPLIAMIATWLSNAFQIGPPGAYMFALSCAAATAMPAPHLVPAQAAALVFAGGAFAWAVHMCGALFAFRGPERSAVTSAGKAVAAFIEAIGTPAESRARHRAAWLLHQAWSVLVSQQPGNQRADDTLSHLRTLNRELHLVFADAMSLAIRQQPPPPELLRNAQRLTAQVYTPEATQSAPSDSVPLGPPGPLAAIAEALKPGSNPMRVVLRVGVASLLAGIVGAGLHLERAYWAVAPAVLMLHQGFDWLRLLRRSLERLLGTWVGLVLAGVILWIHPQGLWLALTVMALTFTIEMLVMRNYAFAAVFITGAALTIASGGKLIDDPGTYLLARGVDTFVGCVIALAIFRLIPPRAAAQRIPQQLIEVLRAIDTLMPSMAHGTVTTTEARLERRALQHASFALIHAHEESVMGSRTHRRAAEHLWPAIAAAERLAYRTLSTCWALERLGGETARESAAAMFGSDGERQLRQVLESFVSAIVERAPPSPLPALPSVLESELENLYQCLRREPSDQDAMQAEA